MQNLFSYPLVVDELSAAEKKYHLHADDEELQYLKEVFKVESVRAFSAEIFVKYKKKLFL